MGNIRQMSTGLWAIIAAVMATIASIAISLNVLDYFSVPDNGYYVSLASRYAAACLTNRKCSEFDTSTQRISLADAPLSSTSVCSKPNAFDVLSATINSKSGYSHVLLKCVDGAAFLFQFSSIGKHEADSGEWVRCKQPSCEAEIRLLPPDI